MEIKQIKCPNCGATMNNPYNSEVYCPYCGSRFIREVRASAAQPGPAPPPQPDRQAPPEVKTVYVRDNRAVPPRPRLRGCLLAFLILVFWPVGLIYLIVVLNKQSAWDNRFGYYDCNPNGRPPYR